MKKKIFALALVVALLTVVVAGTTLAWLTDKTESVVNTFSTSDINITLTESEAVYKMVPGYTIEKDPKVTVLDGSEKCYLFVKLDKSANFDTYLEYVIADGWTKLEGVTDTVYYRVVDGTANQIGTAYSVLKGDQVTVKGSVTKELMNALDKEGAVKPTLTVTAYASQLMKNNTEKFTAAEAWANVPTT